MNPPVEVLYEDNHLLFVNKPGGLLTQPSGTEQENLENILKQWMKERDKKKGNIFLEAVHRLDKQTSGIVVFAKTQKALSRLGEEMRAKNMKKTYLALTENSPPQSEGTLEHYLVHEHHRASVVLESFPEVFPEAKIAKLHYRIVQKNQYVLWEIQLETGRYHQIRAQLAHIGCPIVGDLKYGSTKTLPNEQIALHHSQLELTHPVKKNKIFVSSKTEFMKII